MASDERTALGWLEPHEGFAGAAEIGTPTVPQLFQALSLGFADLARATHERDNDLGEHAAGAVMQALSCLPASLRNDLAYACSDQGREALPEWVKGLAL